MEKLINKLETYKKGVTILIAVIGIIIGAYKIIENNNRQLSLIQKTTLRTMIWSESIPMHDRLEACDSYLGLGYNSETKKYCEKLLEKEFK